MSSSSFKTLRVWPFLFYTLSLCTKYQYHIGILSVIVKGSGWYQMRKGIGSITKFSKESIYIFGLFWRLMIKLQFTSTHSPGNCFSMCILFLILVSFLCFPQHEGVVMGAVRGDVPGPAGLLDAGGVCREPVHQGTSGTQQLTGSNGSSLSVFEGVKLFGKQRWNRNDFFKFRYVI